MSSTKKSQIHGKSQAPIQDYLNNIYQMDGELAPLNKEIIFLIRRSFNNIEEYYQIKYMIKDIIKKNDAKNTTIKNYFKRLITEVRAVQVMHTTSLD